MAGKPKLSAADRVARLLAAGVRLADATKRGEALSTARDAAMVARWAAAVEAEAMIRGRSAGTLARDAAVVAHWAATAAVDVDKATRKPKEPELTPLLLIEPTPR